MTVDVPADVPLGDVEVTGFVFASIVGLAAFLRSLMLRMLASSEAEIDRLRQQVEDQTVTITELRVEIAELRAARDRQGDAK